MPDRASPSIDNPTPIPTDTRERASNFQRGTDGSLTFRGSDGRDYRFEGAEKAALDVPLPSGRKINIFLDKNTSLAAYSPEASGFIFSPRLVELLRHPERHFSEGWDSPEQRAKYYVLHEYTHFEWDELPDEAQDHVVAVFSHPSMIARTRAFGADLVSKKAYREYEISDPTIDECYNFPYAGQDHWYRKEFIANELLAHASIGDVMPREKLNTITSGEEPENFQRRSKEAIDALSVLRDLSPENYAFLQRMGMLQNQRFAADYPIIRQTTLQLGPNTTSTIS